MKVQHDNIEGQSVAVKDAVRQFIKKNVCPQGHFFMEEHRWMAETDVDDYLDEDVLKLFNLNPDDFISEENVDLYVSHGKSGVFVDYQSEHLPEHPGNEIVHLDITYYVVDLASLVEISQMSDRSKKNIARLVEMGYANEGDFNYLKKVSDNDRKLNSYIEGYTVGTGGRSFWKDYGLSEEASYSSEKLKAKEMAIKKVRETCEINKCPSLIDEMLPNVDGLLNRKLITFFSYNDENIFVLCYTKNLEEFEKQIKDRTEELSEFSQCKIVENRITAWFVDENFIRWNGYVYRKK